MVKQLIQKIKELLYVQINVELSVEIEIEPPTHIYSMALDRWFHFSELTPLATTYGSDEAALTPEGFVVMASECEWEDGYRISETEAPVNDAIARHAAIWNGQASQFRGFNRKVVA